ncbi:cyclin-dependent kinases regulatory subunit 1 [Tanacetum coccineum]|uniref:Cyclin-dependent kinases regulatory subunit n=1 Tax=Tanacetum coccineum TaxID=301880 RepID=A0ABQ5AWP5_9ASTR
MAWAEVIGVRGDGISHGVVGVRVFSADAMATPYPPLLVIIIIMGQIQYSEKYFDDTFEYRHVVLPPEVAKMLPKNRLLAEAEWRAIGVQQSRGWVHYAIHRPEPHIMLFRRPLNYQQNQENQAQAHQSLLAK